MSALRPKSWISKSCDWINRLPGYISDTHCICPLFLTDMFDTFRCIQFQIMCKDC